MKYSCLLLFLPLWWMALGSAGAAGYKFRTLSPDGGFYYDGINAISQDADGFIWVMMDYELYRFDGYAYKKYYPYFVSVSDRKRWIFKNMASDSSGQLYINTNNGLFRHNRISDRFDFIADAAQQVAVDYADRIWLRKDNVWGILDMQSGKVSVPRFDGKMPDECNKAFCVNNKDLYVFIGRKVYRFNDVKGELHHCFTLPGNDDGGIIRFAQARAGKLWLATEADGLYQIDLTTFRIEKNYPPPSRL